MLKKSNFENEECIVETTTEWLSQQKAKETPTERMLRYMHEEQMLLDAGYYDDDDELY